MKRRDFLKHIASGSVSSLLFPILDSGEYPGPEPLLQQDRVAALFAKGKDCSKETRDLIRSSSESRIREVCAYLLGNFGQIENAQSLLNTLKDPSERVRRAVLVALQKLLYPQAIHVEESDTTILPPPGSLPSDENHWCDAILPLLRDSSPHVRALAAQTLGWLRCAPAAAGLQVCTEDAVEPVRFYAAVALGSVTGKKSASVHPDEHFAYYAPAVTIGPLTEHGRPAQLGPFLRVAVFEKQGKFTFPGRIPARSQTQVFIWWQGQNLYFKVMCADAKVAGDGDDRFSIILVPGPESYVIELTPKGVTKQVAISPDKTEHEKDIVLNVSTKRNERAWLAELSVSFESLGRSHVPIGETWRANLIRVESHHPTGFGPETSSWAYTGVNPLPANQFGFLHFAPEASVFGFQPGSDNIYTFPLDRYSLPQELNRPIPVGDETNPSGIVAPEHLVRGENVFSLSATRENESRPRHVTITASDCRARVAVASKTYLLPGEVGPSTGSINFEVPNDSRARALDLQIVLSGANGESGLSRICIPTVPLVSPPSRIGLYALQLDENRNTETLEHSQVDARWRIRDLGPMQMNESYPMSLVEGRNNILYGGTYPGGRLFSFNLSSGTLDDLGSPGPPANHLHDLVASPDGHIFGGLYRPEGKLFVYDPSTGSKTDLGVPVPGAFSGSCQVLAWSRGRIYGIQRSHLFYADAANHRIVDKGNFYFRGERYLPATIASDSNGNLLGIAGGKLFRFLPEKDEVLISELEFGGWLLNSPNGSLYAFYPDGRLFVWNPGSDRLNLVSRYPSVPPLGDIHSDDPYGPIEIVLRSTGELVIARSVVSDSGKSSLYIYSRGAERPADLGAPIPGARYLTALTVASSDIVYGLSTERVYGLGRTPVRLYSVSRA